MAERQGSQTNQSNRAPRRALIAAAVVGLFVAFGVYIYAWQLVATGIANRPSPPRAIVVPELANSRCDDTPIVHGSFVWETCFDSALDRVVRFDLEHETAKTWTLPAGLSQSKLRGRIHGWAPTSDGAVVVAGQSVVELSDNGVRVVATYAAKDQILGISKWGDAIEVMSASSSQRQVAITKFHAGGTSERISLTDHSLGMTAFQALGGRRNGDDRWEVLYALVHLESWTGRTETVPFAIADDRNLPPQRFAEMNNVLVDVDLDRDHFMVAGSGMYPENYGSKSRITSLLLAGPTSIERRDAFLAGDPLESVDGMILLYGRDGFGPVLQSVSGKFFGYPNRPLRYWVVDSGTLGVGSHASEDLGHLVASDWGWSPTVFAPQPDGGFVALNGGHQLARLDAALRRSDPLTMAQRIRRGFRTKGVSDILAIGLILFGLPVFVLAGFVVGRRQRFPAIGLAAFAWAVLAVVSMPLFYFAAFAAGL